ncbi:hypothetical protein EDEG_02193 [Edhazardia aedis USNM 41457]|uniref:RNase III domain-containing protein n=1 Tax=Edhazardia aedis (strain USNM 41457) TaxID=1003232 RepID=J8ZUR5_EDHAE|nr:hypothetical protein EDEG_02193 [Edhazardia aedis USNM 41457]|eukprot:EJW03428.1 hypothetical protein EDEG_02193 [Edhazardia aedis USNM 41457]
MFALCFKKSNNINNNKSYCYFLIPLKNNKIDWSYLNFFSSDNFLTSSVLDIYNNKIISEKNNREETISNSTVTTNTSNDYFTDYNTTNISEYLNTKNIHNLDNIDNYFKEYLLYNPFNRIFYSYNNASDKRLSDFVDFSTKTYLEYFENKYNTELIYKKTENSLFEGSIFHSKPFVSSDDKNLVDCSMIKIIHSNFISNSSTNINGNSSNNNNNSNNINNSSISSNSNGIINNNNRNNSNNSSNGINNNNNTNSSNNNSKNSINNNNTTNNSNNNNIRMIENCIDSIENLEDKKYKFNTTHNQHITSSAIKIIRNIVEKQSKSQKGILSSEIIHLTCVKKDFLISMSNIPYFIYAFEIASLAHELKSKLQISISTSRMINCLTPSHIAQKNYERFEFLGDSVLKFVTSKYLFITKTKTLGFYVTKKDSLISNAALFDIAKKINLHHYFTSINFHKNIFQPPDLFTFLNNRTDKLTRQTYTNYIEYFNCTNSFTFSSSTIMNNYVNPLDDENRTIKVYADILEAIIGSIYLESGFICSENFIHQSGISKVNNLIHNNTVSNNSKYTLECSSFCNKILSNKSYLETPQNDFTDYNISNEHNNKNNNNNFNTIQNNNNNDNNNNNNFNTIQNNNNNNNNINNNFNTIQNNNNNNFNTIQNNSNNNFNTIQNNNNNDNESDRISVSQIKTKDSNASSQQHADKSDNYRKFNLINTCQKHQSENNHNNLDMTSRHNHINKINYTSSYNTIENTNIPDLLSINYQQFIKEQIYNNKSIHEMKQYAQILPLNEIKNVEKILSYKFKHRGLIEKALIHPSSHNNILGSVNFNVLELLGDCALDLVVTEKIYHEYSQANPEELHCRRKSMVNNFSLARVLFKTGLCQVMHICFNNDYLNRIAEKLTRDGEAVNKAFGDILESVCGAILVDLDFDFYAFRSYVLKHLWCWLVHCADITR